MPPEKSAATSVARLSVSQLPFRELLPELEMSTLGYFHHSVFREMFPMRRFATEIADIAAEQFRQPVVSNSSQRQRRMLDVLGLEPVSETTRRGRRETGILEQRQSVQEGFLLSQWCLQRLSLTRKARQMGPTYASLGNTFKSRNGWWAHQGSNLGDQFGSKPAIRLSRKHWRSCRNRAVV